MNWKVSYLNQEEFCDVYETAEQIEANCSRQSKVEFPAQIPDNKHCFYYSTFSAYEYDYIHFEGIDTIAEIFINGKKVLYTDNTFKRFDIHEEIKEGENQVVVYVQPKFAKKSVLREIELRRTKKCAITSCRFDVKSIDIENETAKISVFADVHVREDSLHDFSKLTYVFSLKDEKKPFTQEGEVSQNHVICDIDIQRLKPWWPKNFGKSSVYDAKLEIFDGNKLLDVYDERLPLFTIDNSVGSLFINGTKLCLNGPLVTDPNDFESLSEELSAINLNTCMFPKDFEKLPKEDFEPLYDAGILPVFTNSEPETAISADNLKIAIENYRITTLYQPLWSADVLKKDITEVKNVLLPLFIGVEAKTGDLWCVNDLFYGDNVTYTVKDLNENSRLCDSGIFDISSGERIKLSSPAFVSGHRYLISWSTNSGKTHENTFIAG